MSEPDEIRFEKGEPKMYSKEERLEKRIKYEMPSTEEILRAHTAFMDHETRDLFYRTAIELVRLAKEGKTEIKPEEAIATLLLTWNAAYYQYREFNEAHLCSLAALMKKHADVLDAFQTRTINDMDGEKDTIESIFGEFETLLGPVGAAKVLHLLAPRFFPLWDNKIVQRGYHMYFLKAGQNAAMYYVVMRAQKAQCANFSDERLNGMNPLKLIDEYNYSKYTKGWI